MFDINSYMAIHEQSLLFLTVVSHKKIENMVGSRVPYKTRRISFQCHKNYIPTKTFVIKSVHFHTILQSKPCLLFHVARVLVLIQQSLHSNERLMP